MSASRHRVGAVEDVPPGQAIGARVDGIEVAVVNCAGELFAISNRCIHKNGPLHLAGTEKVNAAKCHSPGLGDIDQENRTISCPWHWWEWDLETGEHTLKADERLRTFSVEVDGEDVFVLV